MNYKEYIKNFWTLKVPCYVLNESKKKETKNFAIRIHAIESSSFCFSFNIFLQSMDYGDKHIAQWSFK